jgi:hypothetical protein
MTITLTNDALEMLHQSQRLSISATFKPTKRNLKAAHRLAEFPSIARVIILPSVIVVEKPL